MEPLVAKLAARSAAASAGKVVDAVEMAAVARVVAMMVVKQVVAVAGDEGSDSSPPDRLQRLGTTQRQCRPKMTVPTS